MISAATKYPNLATVLALVFGGYDTAVEAAQVEGYQAVDTYVQSFAGELEVDLAAAELGATAHLAKIQEKSGVPFEGDDAEWDRLVEADSNLAALVKIVVEND